MPAIKARDGWAILSCALLWASFALISWRAVRGESATADETGHAVIGWFMLWEHDYRLYDANPPLWEYWVALGTPRDAIRFNPAVVAYRNVRVGPIEPFWTHLDRYGLLEHGRAMCLMLAIALAVVISIWAWQLGGPVAAVAATLLYALDPNFLGHGPLMKNDVACALTFVLSAMAIWHCGRRLTLPRAAALALFIGIAVNVKFTGLLLLPVLVLAMSARALSSDPWLILGRLVGDRPRKLAAAAATCALVFLAACAITWACYGFRFDGGPDGLQVPMSRFERNLAFYDLRARLHRDPSRAERAAWQPGRVTRALLFAEGKHLVPQAFAEGLVFTQLTDQGDVDAFLLGEHYHGGKWYYFPLAFLFKEPLALIAAVLLALAVRLHAGRLLFASPRDRWTGLSLFIPAAVYAVVACASEINIGYRHFFPVLPFVDIAVGLAAARLWHWIPGRVILLALAGSLAVETAAAYPDYISFFNAAFASSRLQLLSDSNLDWGQDLPELAAWQRANRGVTIYLDYFGDNDPAHYGLKFIDLHENRALAPRGESVVAISATYMQLGGYNAAAISQLGIDFRRRPVAVLGGTIYLFRVANSAQNPEDRLRHS